MAYKAHPPYINFSIDDCILDDVELWDVTESDAAVAASSSRSQKPLLLQNTFPPVPIVRVLEKENLWPYYYPQKLERVDHRMLVAANNTNSSRVLPTVTAPPLSEYSSPVPAKYSVGPEIESPTSHQRWGKEDKGNWMLHRLSEWFPSVPLFKQYQNAAMAILEKGDYTMISGHPFIKKSGWRKISFFFNLSFEIKDKSFEYDQNRNVRSVVFVGS